MVDHHNHQSSINEGGILRFMPNQIFIVNEPVRFENSNCQQNNAAPENKMISFEELSCCEENIICDRSRRNTEQITLLQMLWNPKDSEYLAHFMALNDNILTDQNHSINQNENSSIPVFEIDDTDEEDDVVFVKAYPPPNNESKSIIQERNDLVNVSPKEEKKPRRNPSRKARNSRFGRSSDDDNIYEKDFCMLDSTDDESPSDDSISKISSPEEEKPENFSVKDLKKWPVSGLHERPEYNILTQKIEKFDYTIREIQNNTKKSRLDEYKKPKPIKKPLTKKYILKKRCLKGKVTKKLCTKVPFNSLRELIAENYNILPNFLEIVRKQCVDLHKCHKIIILESNNEGNIRTGSAALNTVEVGYDCEAIVGHNICIQNFENLMINQSRLFSLLNRISFQEAFCVTKKK